MSIIQEKGVRYVIRVGTIMEMEEKKVLVITADFDMVYLKRKPDMFLGQQIRFKKSEVGSINSSMRKYIPLAASVAAVFVLAMVLYFQIFKSGSLMNTYAFVDIDINPGIEFMIDNDNMVLKTSSFNREAEELLKQLKLENLSVDEALSAVLDKSGKAGYIKAGMKNTVLVSAALNEESKEYGKDQKGLKQKLSALMNSFKEKRDIKDNAEIDFKTIKAEPEVKERALKNGISIGREVIFEKAKEKGIELSLEEAKHMSISEMLKKVDMEDTLKEPEKETAQESPEPTRTSGPGVTSGRTPTPVGSASVDPTKLPASPTPLNKTVAIKVQYYNAPEVVGDTMQINPKFRVVNTGKSMVNLADIKIRYYYTIDGESSQSFDCWAQKGKENITSRFVKLKTVGKNTDYFLEVGFRSGILSPGESTVVNTWFNKGDWSTYKQDNDYSYNPRKTNDYYDWVKVTGYVKGSLKWGVEPGVSGIVKPKPVPTQTPKVVPMEVPKVSAVTGSKKIILHWNATRSPGFVYYKVVISKKNPKPRYPEDGYLVFFTDRNVTEALIDNSVAYNGGDFGQYLVPGEGYYFSITSVYEKGAVPGNVLYLKFPKN